MNRGGRKLRVLVVEDSSVVRVLLTHIVNADSELQVIAEASDGESAIQLVDELRPDVILMDIGLPGIDGLEATRTIMASVPTPIVLISAAYERGNSTKTFEALASGALTVLPKPRAPGTDGFADDAATIAITLKLMAEVKIVRRRRSALPAAPGQRTGSAKLPKVRRDGPPDIVAIAASTGGPAALAAILRALPAAFSLPILVVQHITPGFHDGLVRWLSGITPLSVALARQSQPLHAGEVLIAPPEAHLGVARGRVDLCDHGPIEGHRPSATHLFSSVGEVYGRGAVGVILTGMGDDGARGLEVLKREGGLVVAQDEATSAVYGMPREAIVRGLADHVLPLPMIAPALQSLASGGSR